MVEKFKEYLKEYFSNGPKSTIFTVSLVLIILTTVIFSTRKTIIVSVDGADKKVTTFSSTYKDALNK